MREDVTESLGLVQNRLDTERNDDESKLKSLRENRCRGEINYIYTMYACNQYNRQQTKAIKQKRNETEQTANIRTKKNHTRIELE